MKSRDGPELEPPLPYRNTSSGVLALSHFPVRHVAIALLELSSVGIKYIARTQTLRTKPPEP